MLAFIIFWLTVGYIVTNITLWANDVPREANLSSASVYIIDAFVFLLLSHRRWIHYAVVFPMVGMAVSVVVFKYDSQLYQALTNVLYLYIYTNFLGGHVMPWNPTNRTLFWKPKPVETPKTP
jgi:hypothetical protein